MFCHECGTSLPENAKFCPVCGQATVQKENASIQQEIVELNTADEEILAENKNIHCPNCGGKNCKSHYKQSVTSTGGGYGCLQGGLGFLLAGPFGLLCGLCGRSTHTTTTNTLVWVCQNCGLEFRSRKDVLEATRFSKKIGYWILIVCGGLADIIKTLDNSFGIVSTVSFMLWLTGLACSAIFFWVARAEPRNDAGINYSFSDLEKQDINNSVRKLAITTAILVIYYCVLWAWAAKW